MKNKDIEGPLTNNFMKYNCQYKNQQQIKPQQKSWI